MPFIARLDFQYYNFFFYLFKIYIVKKLVAYSLKEDGQIKYLKLVGILISVNIKSSQILNQLKYKQITM